LTWNSPVTCEATSCESVKIFTFLAPMSWAVRKPAKKASYSAVLLVTGKYKAREILTMIPLLSSTIIPALLHLELDDPSTKTVHSSVLSSSGKSFRRGNQQTPAPLVTFWIRSVCQTRIARVTTSSSDRLRQGDPKFV
jgi:hypothetical protein